MTSNKQQTEINAVEYLSKVNQFAKKNNTDNPRQQTAIEWLEGQIIKFHNWKRNPEFDENCFDEIELHKSIQQAEEMHKQRIAKAFTDGKAQNFSFYDKTGEQYYNETFGGGKL